MFFLITIQDKERAGEPDIGMAIVMAKDEEEALKSSVSMLAILAEAGFARCRARAKQIELGQYYRVNALLRR